MGTRGKEQRNGLNVVFWGASGHAKVLHECISQMGYKLVAIFDNQAGLASPILGTPIYSGMSGFQDWLALGSRSAFFLIAIGSDKGRDRLAIHAELQKHGLKPLTVTHPTAFVAADTEIGPGCQVLANSSVCAGVRLGSETIINTNASVDHECLIGSGVHVGPGATLAGCVEVGDNAMIGAGAVVLPRVKIGADAVVGAGAVVTRDLPAGAVAYGNPARLIKLKVRK
jgi:sugar O-acyltransferase (sialic acid O-acetyltransferase NeuD family)